jgi:hypothetical protein
MARTAACRGVDEDFGVRIFGLPFKHEASRKRALFVCGWLHL